MQEKYYRIGDWYYVEGPKRSTVTSKIDRSLLVEVSAEEYAQGEVAMLNTINSQRQEIIKQDIERVKKRAETKSRVLAALGLTEEEIEALL